MLIDLSTPLAFICLLTLFNDVTANAGNGAEMASNLEYQHPYCKYPIHPCYFRLNPSERKLVNSFSSSVVKLESGEGTRHGASKFIPPAVAHSAPKYPETHNKQQLTLDSFPELQVPLSALKGLPLKPGSRILIEFPAGFIKPGVRSPPAALVPMTSGGISLKPLASEKIRSVFTKNKSKISLQPGPIILPVPTVTIPVKPVQKFIRKPEPIQPARVPAPIIRESARQPKPVIVRPKPQPRPVTLPQRIPQIVRPAVSLAKPSPIRRPRPAPAATCPRANYKPCITKDVANRKAVACCKRVTSVAPQCHHLCNIDVTPSQMFAALQNGHCSQSTIQPILTCLSEGKDLRPCCAAKGVTAGNRAVCAAFCNPSGGIPRFTPRYLRCVPQWRNAVDCYWAHMNP